MSESTRRPLRLRRCQIPVDTMPVGLMPRSESTQPRPSIQSETRCSAAPGGLGRGQSEPDSLTRSLSLELRRGPGSAPARAVRVTVGVTSPRLPGPGPGGRAGPARPQAGHHGRPPAAAATATARLRPASDSEPERGFVCRVKSQRQTRSP
jgi:hypothetical protein